MLEALTANLANGRLAAGRVVFLVLVGPERVLEAILLATYVAAVTQRELLPFFLGSSSYRRSFRRLVLGLIVSLLVVQNKLLLRNELKATLRTLIERGILDGVDREPLNLGVFAAFRVSHAHVAIQQGTTQRSMVALRATVQAVRMLPFIVGDPTCKIWKRFLAFLALSMFL